MVCLNAMQRITTLAACRELGVLVGLPSPACPWRTGAFRKQPVCRRWACMYMCAVYRHIAGESWKVGRQSLPKFKGQSAIFAGNKHRLYSTEREEEKGRSNASPNISVVGIPDPITWIRCKALMYLIEFYFELGITTVDFDKGVKQALVHVSNMMSSGNFHKLRGLVSKEMLEYVEQKCSSLSEEQKQQLAISLDDIIFLLPEDVSLLFDTRGRKFCFIVMRFWLLSSLDGPHDPEGTRIFQVNSNEDEGPQKKIVTAVYEFHREVTEGAAPDWTITNVWHWHWKQAE